MIINRFLTFSKVFCLAIVVMAQGEARANGRSYADVKIYMKKIAQDYPQSATLFDLGMSDAGEMIQGLRLGHGAIKQLVVGTHHGNEYGSTEVTKAFALSVAQTPLPDTTMFVIPVLNISGYNAGERRETANGTTYDPNRDYPGPCGTEGPYHLKSTAALAKLLDSENIVASATMHTYTPAVVYPWGMSTHDLSTPYDNLFINLVKAATVESKYTIGNNTQVLYPADGAFEDYAFWKHGIWSILFELGNSHSPSNNNVSEMIRTNIPGMRRMFTLAPPERAPDHLFKGKCDIRLHSLDRHDE